MGAGPIGMVTALAALAGGCSKVLTHLIISGVAWVSISGVVIRGCEG